MIQAPERLEGKPSVCLGYMVLRVLRGAELGPHYAEKRDEYKHILRFSCFTSILYLFLRNI